LRIYNLAGISSELFRSELFGHRKGAFTGAVADRIGYFEEAEGGTLVLDEIGDMPMDAQVHLLRVLQERKIQRLGENTLRDVNVRIIAMTNRNLEQDVRDNRFRGDLYYRLNEFHIHLPALRDHLEDAPLLAEHFLMRYTEKRRKIDGFAPEVMDMLKSYPWPGNIRELENEVELAADYAIYEGAQVIQAYHFSSRITQGSQSMQDIILEGIGYKESLDIFKRRLIEETLRKSEGNHTKAAQMLGMQRPNLVALIKSLGIKFGRIN